MEMVVKIFPSYIIVDVSTDITEIMKKIQHVVSKKKKKSWGNIPVFLFNRSHIFKEMLEFT
jgi:hypothetical protein